MTSDERSRRWAALLLLLVVVAAAIPQLLLFDRALQDDAFISFIYARNLAEGQGLVYNRGEPPVEGYTNFLWTVISAAGISLGLNPAHVVQVLSMLAAAGVVIMTWRLAAALGAPPLFAVASSLLLATKAPFAVETMGGLETTFFTVLVLGAVILRLPARAAPSRQLAASLLLAAAALTRPEGVLFFALLEIFALLERLIGRGDRDFPGYLRRAAYRVVPFLLVVGSHVAWRFATYGDLVPNTFHAKVTGRPGLYLNGLSYVWEGALDFGPLLFILPLVVSLWRRRERAWRLCLLLNIPFCVYIISVGGDFKPTMRFLVPVLPIWCALAVEGARFAVERIRVVPGRFRGIVAATLIVALGGWSAHRHYQRLSPGMNREIRLARFEAIGRHLDEVLPPGAWIAVSTAGVIPYFARRRTIDMLGLNDAHIARQPARPSRGVMVGHEKGDGEYVLRRSPDVILFFLLAVTTKPLSWSPDWLKSTQALAYGASEREIAAHPEFRRSYEPVETMLPDGSYLNYFVRKGLGLALPPGAVTQGS